MPLRFKLLISLFLAVGLLAVGHDSRIEISMVEVFACLGALLVVSVISLWPNEGRKDRAERQVSASGGWADRLDVESMAEDYSRRTTRD